MSRTLGALPLQLLAKSLPLPQELISIDVSVGEDGLRHCFQILVGVPGNGFFALSDPSLGFSLCHADLMRFVLEEVADSICEGHGSSGLTEIVVPAGPR
jgi:hypothetical protein